MSARLSREDASFGARLVVVVRGLGTWLVVHARVVSREIRRSCGRISVTTLSISRAASERTIRRFPRQVKSSTA